MGGGADESSERTGQRTPTWLTHNLPDGDWLGQSGRLAAPRDVHPNDPENDSGACGKVLDREATALHRLRVSRDPVLGCERGAMLGVFLPTFLEPWPAWLEVRAPAP